MPLVVVSESPAVAENEMAHPVADSAAESSDVPRTPSPQASDAEFAVEQTAHRSTESDTPL